MNYSQGQASNAINQGAVGMQAIPPRTIASAIGRVDGLNERLMKVCEHLASISDQIGGPRPAENGKSAGKLPSAGAVGRLNDSVEGSHDYLSEIESLVSCIGRALG